MSHDARDTSDTHASLVHDVPNTDCQPRNGSGHGCFTTSKQRFRKRTRSPIYHLHTKKSCSECMFYSIPTERNCNASRLEVPFLKGNRTEDASLAENVENVQTPLSIFCFEFELIRGQPRWFVFFTNGEQEGLTGDGAGIAQWLEHQPLIERSLVRIPAGAAGEFSSSGSTSVLTLSLIHI